MLGIVGELAPPISTAAGVCGATSPIGGISGRSPSAAAAQKNPANKKIPAKMIAIRRIKTLYEKPFAFAQTRGHTL
jgi:hypothetical protein